MAPELGRLGERYDGMAVDVFAAGVLLYRLLYNQFPWIEGDNLPEHLRHILIKQMLRKGIPYL